GRPGGPERGCRGTRIDQCPVHAHQRGGNGPEKPVRLRDRRAKRRPDGRDRPPGPRRPVFRDDERMTRLRVLTVDDSRTILAMLHHTLSNAGFEVLQAEDGRQGLDVLKTETVDVVITDINMPVMDGIEFIKNVRASGQHQSLPILILTTETSQDKRDQG